MKRLKKHYPCPVEFALEFVGGKWKAVILAWIKEGPHRYGDLRRKIPGISEKILSEKLKDLEKLGMIERIRDSNDLSVHLYRLTPAGEGLRPVLDHLYEWGGVMARELGIAVETSP